MKQHEENTIEQILKRARAVQEDINAYRSIDIERAFLKTERKIRWRTRKEAFLFYAQRVAAILFIPLLVSSLLFSYLYFKGTEPDLYAMGSSMEVSVAPGTITHFELPDHSKVWLNSGSKLRYPARFAGKERKIELDGEAYFEVKSDSLCPFVVKTPMGMEVVAKGTSFNVCAYGEESRLETILEEGRIDVRTKTRKVTLSPSEELVCTGPDTPWDVSTVTQKGQTSWRDGHLIFRNTELDEVFRRLSRKYNVSFVFHGNKNRDYRLWASFSDETITQIMDYLTLIAPMEWTMTRMKQQGDATFTRQQIDIHYK